MADRAAQSRAHDSIASGAAVPGTSAYIWFGQMISLTGTWVQNVAQRVASPETHRVGIQTWTGYHGSIHAASGARAYRRRNCRPLTKAKPVVATQVISALLAVGLGVLVRTGAVSVLAYPGLRRRARHRQRVLHACPPGVRAGVVEKEALFNAVALNSAIFNASRVVADLPLAACWWLCSACHSTSF